MSFFGYFFHKLFILQIEFSRLFYLFWNIMPLTGLNKNAEQDREQS